MFGKKALKEEVSFLKKKIERIENEKWDVYRDNGQLERDKMEMRNGLYAKDSEILVLKKENKTLIDKCAQFEKQNNSLVKSLNNKFTKEELIEQLAEVLLNENREDDKTHLINQMNAALRINNVQPTPEGDGSQWIPQP